MRKVLGPHLEAMASEARNVCSTVAEGRVPLASACGVWWLCFFLERFLEFWKGSDSVSFFGERFFALFVPVPWACGAQTSGGPRCLDGLLAHLECTAIFATADVGFSRRKWTHKMAGYLLFPSTRQSGGFNQNVTQRLLIFGSATHPLWQDLAF